ncbi:10 kDa chaperonin [Hibiscus syriacus]|uniref:20 kDa chaperonin, chloroplastic n=1 Tax=Hibiscus syriacus TaxID=106335 RepID=A0A6A2ZB59_HIBSY|nr:10 kDa chaperonin [Hibiscus syriacus]
MATSQLTAPSVTVSARNLASFEGLRHSSVKFASFGTLKPGTLTHRPLGDRVLVRIKEAGEKTEGGIFLPTTAQSNPQGGEVVAVGEGKTVGKTKVECSVQSGAQVIYSKYAGTEIEFNGANHLLLKEDDIVGILESDDIKDLKPLNERVLIKGPLISNASLIAIHKWFLHIRLAEEKTAGGLLLTQTTKEKPSIGTVIAVGPGTLDDEGNAKPLSVAPGNTVLYSKYAGNDFKGNDGRDYIALRASEIMAAVS